MDGQQRGLESLLGWLPGWLGFVLIIAAGVVAIVVGAMTPDLGFVAFGVAAIASAVLAWVNGATSSPRIDPFKTSFGGVVTGIDGWVWVAVFLMFLAAVVVALVT